MPFYKKIPLGLISTNCSHNEVMRCSYKTILKYLLSVKRHNLLSKSVNRIDHGCLCYELDDTDLVQNVLDSMGFDPG